MKAIMKSFAGLLILRDLLQMSLLMTSLLLSGKGNRNNRAESVSTEASFGCNRVFIANDYAECLQHIEKMHIIVMYFAR